MSKLKQQTNKVTKKPVKKSTWIKENIWNSRPIHWLAVGVAYISIAYTTYQVSKAYISIPELTGITAFVATIVICSRLTRNK